ncbi:MAG: Peptidoglycan D,D-transpeptidase MrdA [Gammaproteobacteria bacterium]|nr:Peptidoglycan D,D-transpeptidase MrdA [Gammaproteobacteria bacterium]
MKNDFRLQDYLHDTKLIQSRLIVTSVIVLLLAGSLLWRLFELQIVQNERFNTLSQENRIRYLPLAPARGQIYDRNGIPLAQNLPVYAVEVQPERVDDIESLLNRVSQLVVLSSEEVERFRETLRTRPRFETRVLKSGLSDEEVARFAANQPLIEGAELSARLQRHYPLGQELVHVVGYVGRISENDLARIDTAAYRGTDYIGKLGIEGRYEDVLLGKVGYKKVETNAHGKIVRVLSSKKSVAGSDLHLSVDANLQRAAREYLGEFQGAVVAVEPSSGAILAFVSNPVYDPNPFVEGIGSRDYQTLRQDPRRPLLNRALNGRYAPGSTIKPIFAMAALEHGRSPVKTTFCPGYFKLPGSSRRYRCWKRQGHGYMNLYNAIVQSCDVYFYQLARTLGIEKLSDAMVRFGLGRQTGIDLTGEPSGLAPTPEWKREVRGKPWYPGETISVGIGQGYTLVTPLQMAMATATLANRGKRMQPKIVAYMRDASTNQPQYEKPKMLDRVDARSSDYFRLIIDAMTDVVHGRRGTARRSGRGATYRFAGKTGTAQVIGIAQGESYDEQAIAKRFRDHALFISFAPVEDPKIAVAVIAENGGGGSRTAAPIARKVMDFYLVGPPEEEKTSDAT